MTHMEYDSSAMRSALTELSGIYKQLTTDRSNLSRTWQVTCPGDAPTTKAYDQRFKASVHSMLQDHDTFAKAIKSAMDGLVAVDRQYNNGELANELGFKKIQGGNN